MLNNGVAIPQLGLGVYRSPNGAETFETVRYALVRQNGTISSLSRGGQQ